MSWSTFLRRNYWKIKRLGIDLNELNAVRFRGEESFNHRLVKFIVCNHLLELGHHFKTEQRIKDSICDVIDLDTFVVYEIETNATEKIVKKKIEDFCHPFVEDIFIIDLKKLRFDWSCFLKFSKYVGKYCGLR